MMTETAIAQKPLRCFCSFVAKRTAENIFVCGRYESEYMVCLFHVHEENVEAYHQPTEIPMAFDCELCLATFKIHSKEYIAPCRMTTVRCHCGAVATFSQSKQNNSNQGAYFFGCPFWRTDQNCRYFAWAHEQRTVREGNTFRALVPSESRSRKRIFDCDESTSEDENEEMSSSIGKKIHHDLRQRFECIICFDADRSYMVTPCNHLCCCSTCAIKLHNECPICRAHIESIQRIFFA